MKQKKVAPEGMIIERGYDCLYFYHKGGKEPPLLQLIINGVHYSLPRLGSIELKEIPEEYKWAMAMKVGDKISIMGRDDIQNALDTFFKQ